MRRATFLRFLSAAAGSSVACRTLQGAQTAQETPSGVFDVRGYGAAGDGRSMDTQAIQAAIDASAAAGGGRVYLHNGAFLCGAIRLKSNVTLYIESGAVLLGSSAIEDYPDWPSSYPSRSSGLYTRRSLIYAEKAENVAILGGGAIDGQGRSPAFRRTGKMGEADRPLLLRFSECRNVKVKDVTLRNSAMWVQNYLACDNLTLDGLTIDSRVNSNNDGIDVDDCWYVRITNCDIRSGDDAICLKSTSSRGCRHVVVANCTVSSNCSAFKLGTDSTGGFQDISLTNCAFYDTGLAGIAIECVDGGLIDRVIVSNVTMRNVKGPIFLRLGNRGRGMEKPAPGRLRNVVITNIEASGASDVGSSITGLPGSPVENVTLERIRIRSRGGGTSRHASRQIPESPDRYPEYDMFVAPPGGEYPAGTRVAQLPGHGIYVRHASGLALRDIDLRFDAPDDRPALVFDDVDGLNLFDVQGDVTPAAAALLWLKRTAGVLLHGCRVAKGMRTFLRVDGVGPGEVVLMDNDFGGVANVVERGDAVPGNAVVLVANRTK